MPMNRQAGYAEAEEEIGGSGMITWLWLDNLRRGCGPPHREHDRRCLSSKGRSRYFRIPEQTSIWRLTKAALA
jgi:hypothetical protein